MRSVVCLIALLALYASVPSIAMTRRQAQIADLEVAKNDYVLKSLAFTPDRRLQALNSLKNLEARAGSLSDMEFLIGIAHLAALADNGHDAVAFGDDSWVPPTRLPFRMLAFSDSTVVSRAAPEYAELLGARVNSIEGRSPAEIVAALATISGGTPQYRSWNAEWAIERGGVLHALGLAAAPDRLRFDFRLRDGRHVQRAIPFVPAGRVPSGVYAPRLLSPQPFTTELAAGWRAANASAKTPLYLEQPDALFRSVSLPSDATLYVQFRANFDMDGQQIVPFVKSVSDTIARTHPHNVIIDLRYDTGGNNELTLDLMRSIPQQVPGRIYALVGRYTFSAGIASAAALKHAGTGRVVVVGEPVGDRLRWWSEGKPACLPHSHLCLHPTTGLWDLAKGCAAEAHCYGDKYDENVGSLDPQIAAPLTAQAWLNGDDPALDAIGVKM